MCSTPPEPKANQSNPSKLAVYLITEPSDLIVKTTPIQRDKINGKWQYVLPEEQQTSYKPDDMVSLRVTLKNILSDIDVIDAENTYFDTSGAVILTGFVYYTNKEDLEY
ncbi:MAG: hypothetical protein KBB91_01990 [Candidatus Pacebacteria bacterium]|nr:hypothetical protein [Candidatus Paceibacterota bacterium]